MAKGLDEDEEARFLRDNEDLLPLCLVDAACIAVEYLMATLGVCSTSMDPGKAGLSIEEYALDDDLGIVLSKEREFEAQLSHIFRFKEDVFLSDDADSEPVKVSTLLGPTF